MSVESGYRYYQITLKKPPPLVRSRQITDYAGP
jgi:hypothetical protein